MVVHFSQCPRELKNSDGELIATCWDGTTVNFNNDTKSYEWCPINAKAFSEHRQMLREGAFC